MKFIVKCQQFVEEVCEIEVEADTYQEAVQQVMDEDLMVDADWNIGTDSYEPEVYLVVDEKGTTVWDRNLKTLEERMQPYRPVDDAVFEEDDND